MLLSNLLYADDLVLLAENAEDLQVLLRSLQEWCQIWDVTVNPTKSAIIHFRPKSHCKSTQVFSLSGEILTVVSEYKYLGVTLDEFLTFLPAASNRIDLATKAFWSLQSAITDLPGDVFKNHW